MSVDLGPQSNPASHLSSSFLSSLLSPKPRPRSKTDLVSRRRKEKTLVKRERNSKEKAILATPSSNCSPRLEKSMDPKWLGPGFWQQMKLEENWCQTTKDKLGYGCDKKKMASGRVNSQKGKSVKVKRDKSEPNNQKKGKSPPCFSKISSELARNKKGGIIYQSQ
jgi:hypothetical protein